MMTSLFPGNGSKMEAVGNVVASTDGTAIVGNASAGSDGAWTELIASTAHDYYGFHIIIANGSVSGLQLIDVGIGAAGSEVVLVNDLMAIVRGTVQRCPSLTMSVPLYLPKGSRIAARVHRGSTNSTANRISILGQTGTSFGIPPFLRATSYGVVLASAAGTTVDPGAVANTQGAMTEIVASTTNPIRVLYVLATRNQTTATAGSPTTLLELFIGAAAAEVTLVPEFTAWCSNATVDAPTGEICYGPLFVNLPSGTRIAAKARCSSATATEREGMMTLVGLD